MRYPRIIPRPDIDKPWGKLPKMEDRIRLYFQIYPHATAIEAVTDVGCTTKDVAVVFGPDTPFITSQTPRSTRHHLCVWCATTVWGKAGTKTIEGVTGYFHNECEMKAKEFNR